MDRVAAAIETAWRGRVSKLFEAGRSNCVSQQWVLIKLKKSKVSLTLLMFSEQRNLEQYWEMQSEWKDGYNKAKKLWTEIEPIYLKFHAYVRRRLQKIYPEVPDPIPVHLLGN